MLIGYARVSTLDQTLALQQDALTAAGCEHIYTDTVSGSVTDRPGLSQALSHLRAGDTLVVWRLDRLGRSLSHLIEVVRQLQARGVGFRSLQEQLDTATSAGSSCSTSSAPWRSLNGTSSGSGHTPGYKLLEHAAGCLADPRR